jgi:hypothetical protein
VWAFYALAYSNFMCQTLDFRTKCFFSGIALYNFLWILGFLHAWTAFLIIGPFYLLFPLCYLADKCAGKIPVLPPGVDFFCALCNWRGPVLDLSRTLENTKFLLLWGYGSKEDRLMKGFCYGFPEKAHRRAPWFLKHFRAWSNYMSDICLIDNSLLPPVEPNDRTLGEEADNYYVHKPSTPELLLNPETAGNPVNKITAECLTSMMKKFRHFPVMWDKALKTWVAFDAAVKKLTFVRPFV